MLLLVLSVLTVGCATSIPPIPTSSATYRQLQYSKLNGYLPRTIYLHNLRRVLDSGLDESSRLQSLRLVMDLRQEGFYPQSELSNLLADPACPPQLHQALAAAVSDQEYPAAPRTEVMATGSGISSSTSIATWTPRSEPSRPDPPRSLPELVKLWAQQPTSTGKQEVQYRQMVAQLTGQPWPEALVDAINSADFLARGSAIELLAGRVSTGQLRSMIVRVSAATEAMSALQAFLEEFDYLPSTRQEFWAITSIYRLRGRLIPDVGRLARNWSSHYGYRFNVRDFHLLSRIVTDTSRTAMNRDDLVAYLRQATADRQHVADRLSRAVSSAATGRFEDVQDQLEITDLWNLYLMDEMLVRRRVRLAISVMAERDFIDKSSAWGGLVFYEGGRAEAKLYPPDNNAVTNDLTYVPSEKMKLDSLDSMCRFYGHFERVENVSRAGPGVEERHELQTGNAYGVIFTRIDVRHFCVHYCNPQGVVVSLGVFPFDG